MTDEKLIEEAAKAIFEADPPNNPHGPNSDLVFDEPYTRDHSARARKHARAALAVFEKAHTPTDDEQEALAFAVAPGDEVGLGDAISIIRGKTVEATIDWVRRNYAVAPGLDDEHVGQLIIALNLVRNAPEPQGEPSDAQVLAAAIALTGGSAILFAELDAETQERYLDDARAALRASFAVTEQGDVNPSVGSEPSDTL